jgi:periplasmic divalent cation tolerance protein
MTHKSKGPDFARDSSDQAHVVLALTTWPADRPADAFARALVDRRLAACVNVLPLQRSTYRWQGTVEAAEEHQVLMKTTRARIGALEHAVRDLHPYEVPEWLVIDVAGGSESYLRWVRESVGES